MRHFNEDFKTQLWDAVAAIETESRVEVVVMIKAGSEVYADVALWFGAALAFLAFTYFMFAPQIFGDYLVYTGSIGAFFLGYFAVSFIPWLKRLLLSRKRMARSVEIMARALFQKGGMHHTESKIGTLIYCSVLEKSVYILADRGAETAIPLEEWELLRANFSKIFAAANPAQALLAELDNSRGVFQRYIPPVEDDINELPDDLEVVL